jgi:flagella basal body P-ring formation protein FlgA
MIRSLSLLPMLFAMAANAASPRAFTALHDPNVYLRDLFDDAGPNAGTMLGPGPEPGGRIIVEAAQLDAIARQYGVAWRSTSRAERTVVERAGRPLRLSEVIDALRTAVAAAGFGDDRDIDLSGFAPPAIPAETAKAPAVSQLDIVRETGHFTALLTIGDDGSRPVSVRVSGHIVSMVDTPVARANLPADTILRARDVQLVRMRLSAGLQGVPGSLDEVIGMQLKRPIAAGQPMRAGDLVRPPLVRRGSPVHIALETVGLSVTGIALALESGSAGDTIRVQNTTSRTSLYATVVGPDKVRIAPEAPFASQAGGGVPQ